MSAPPPSAERETLIGIGGWTRGSVEDLCSTLDRIGPINGDKSVVIAASILRKAADMLTADAPAKQCTWTEDSEGYYSTTCGEAYVFNDGTPTQNNACFCHHCGGKLEVKP